MLIDELKQTGLIAIPRFPVRARERGEGEMELKECIDTILLLLDDHGELFDECEKKALNKLLVTAEAVKKWRGKLPEKRKCNHPKFCNGSQNNIKFSGSIFCSSCEKTEAYNQAIDDCATAYVANMPTREELLSLIMEINRQELVENEVPYSSAAIRIGQEIHNLIVGKVREK